MTGFQQVLIGGYPGGGLVQDKKPALLAKEAFSKLENAYVFRERVKKRDGEVPMGHLQRDFDTLFMGANNTGTVMIIDNFNFVTDITNANPGIVTTQSPHHITTGDVVGFSHVNGMTQVNNEAYVATVIDNYTFSITDTSAFGVYTSGGITVSDNDPYSPYPTVVEGSVTILAQATGVTYTDDGQGLMIPDAPGPNGTINYVTGIAQLPLVVNSKYTATFSYYPNLPVMGILKRDIPTVGIDSTVFFDTVFAYQYQNGFQELVPGTTWSGSNTDFFWSSNFQGSTADLRYFFVTNNNIDVVGATYDPIRYYNNSTWNDLQPLVSATDTLWQAQIIIPYYGRLLALNTWEGPTAGGYTGAKNFFSRCRFSQIGDPIDQTNSWRSDIFGRGGFLDAPTNESIVSVAFFRNTLIVFFEYSTWQLRYLGEYGLPFIFERISSDFGAVSPFSPIIFDQGVMVVGDRGIVQAAANGVTRLDDQIPNEVFGFEIQNKAPNFVHGIRDFEKELVYWNYIDTTNQSINQNYPNTVLLFNYRNNTWAKFRDTITCFGIAQFQFGITWDSLTTFWESSITWDNVDNQQYVDYVTSGTQHGFINIYNDPDAETPQPVNSLYAPSMIIIAVDFTQHPTQVTIPDHNLANGEIIYIQGTLWQDGVDPGLNNQIYSVTVVDSNIVTLSIWDVASGNYDAVDIISDEVYIGGGKVTLFPKMNIVGKDFNPFQGAGKQFKLSFIDFQMDSNLTSPAITALTVQLFVNSYLGEQANMIATNNELQNSSQNCGFITGASQSNPCQVTSPNHSLITGTLIYIANVQGMTQLNAAIYTITVVDANNFTLNGVDSTGFSAYTTGGIWNTSPVNGQTYIPGSEYAWYRFYSTQFGQYLRVGLTYDDTLMNQLATHQMPMEMNSMNLWLREGGRLIN